MSANRYPFPRREKKNILEEILDFGPDQTDPSPDVSQRIQRIVDKLEDINRRIDILAGRFE